MAKSSGKKLIQELLSNPDKFDNDGKAYQLLQDYFEGYPIETLRRLLQSDNQMVIRSAIWIASELGKEAYILVPEVRPLVHSSNRFIRYYAIEILMVCSFADYAQDFIHVVRAIESDDEVISCLSMDLVSRADAPRINSVVPLLSTTKKANKQHIVGLSRLIKSETLDSQEIVAMLNDEDPILRKYGAIIASKIYDKHPEVIADGASSSDPVISKFCKDVVKFWKSS